MFENSKIAAVEALNLPKDVALGEVLVSFVGRRCVVVENYRKILIYTDTLVKLQAKTCKVLINGKRLAIEYYTDDEMKVTGLLQSVEFEGL